MANLPINNSIHFNNVGDMSDDRLVVASKAQLFNGTAPYVGQVVYLNSAEEKGLYVFKTVGTSWETSSVSKLIDADSAASQEIQIFNFVGALEGDSYPKFILDNSVLKYYTDASTSVEVSTGDMFKVSQGFSLDAEHYAGVTNESSVSLETGALVIVTAVGANWKLIDISINLSEYLKKSTAPQNTGACKIAAFDGQGSVFETTVPLSKFDEIMSQGQSAPISHTHSIEDITEKPATGLQVVYNNIIIDAPIFQFEELASDPANFDFEDNKSKYVVHFRNVQDIYGNMQYQCGDYEGEEIFRTLDPGYDSENPSTVTAQLIPNGTIYIITSNGQSSIITKAHLTPLEPSNYYEGIVYLSGIPYLLSLEYLSNGRWDVLKVPLISTSDDERSITVPLDDITTLQGHTHLANVDFTWKTALKTVRYTLLQNGDVVYTEYTNLQD